MFFTTAIGLGLVACAMLYLSWCFAANVGNLNGWLAIGTTALIFVIGGFMLVIKRAIATAVIEGVDNLDLGPKILHMLFTKMLDVEDTENAASRLPEPPRIYRFAKPRTDSVQPPCPS